MRNLDRLAGSNLKEYIINGHSYQSYKDLPSSISATLKHVAKRQPDKIALVDENKSITYRELENSVNAFAGALNQDYGVCKGDICAMLVVNSIDFCIAFYAIIRLGAIAMPISTKLKSDEIIYPIMHSKCKLAISDAAWIDKIYNIINHTNLNNIILTDNTIEFSKEQRKKNYYDFQTISNLIKRRNRKDFKILNDELSSLSDEAILIYTSGTTGNPKGALINNFNVLHSINSYEKILNLNHEDKTIIATPIFHITGLVALLCLFVKIGATSYLHSSFDSRKAIDCVKENKITFIHASPTIFLLMVQELNEDEDISSLTKGACGSANLPIGIIREIRKFNEAFKMYPVYGLTETSSPATIMPFDPVDECKEGSSGIAIPGVELRIVEKTHGRVLPCNTVGQLEIKGSCVIEKYFHANEEEKDSFCDGWFNTGDIALVDEDGFVYILDRVKDMINRGGEKIYSIEVENAINDHPDVIESAVIGLRDEVYGEEVHAIIKTNNSNLSEKALDEYLQQKLAKYKIPRSYDFVQEIPKNMSGKFNKKEIRKRLQESR